MPQPGLATGPELALPLAPALPPAVLPPAPPVPALGEPPMPLIPAAPAAVAAPPFVVGAPPLPDAAPAVPPLDCDAPAFATLDVPAPLALPVSVWRVSVCDAPQPSAKPKAPYHTHPVPLLGRDMALDGAE
jgi:hypothetical protein